MFFRAITCVLQFFFRVKKSSSDKMRYSPPPGTIDEREIRRHLSRTSLNSEGEFIPDMSVSKTVLFDNSKKFVLNSKLFSWIAKKFV